MHTSIFDIDQVRQTTVSEKASLKDALAKLSINQVKLVHVVNESGKLLGTLSDGDVRRGLLAGHTLSSSILNLANLSPHTLYRSDSPQSAYSMAVKHRIRYIPIIANDGVLVGLYEVDVNVPNVELSNTMVIMAGGLGTRMMPHTVDCPKPMLKIDGQPILEHIIIRAKASGFKNFLITTHYLSNQICDYFGNGANHDINISYTYESERLGTAGALASLPDNVIYPIMVTNGDVIVDINYSEVLDYHRHHESMATMAVKVHEIQNPYGVVNVSGINVVGFQEKPIYKNFVNTGVYVLEQSIVALIHKTPQYIDMPDLLMKAINLGYRGIVYPLHESWSDIGTPSDLSKFRQK